MSKINFMLYTVSGVHRHSHRCGFRLSLSTKREISDNEGINRFGVFQPFGFSQNLPFSLGAHGGLHIRHVLCSPRPVLPSTLSTKCLLPQASTHAPSAPHAIRSSLLTPVVDESTMSLLKDDLPPILAHCDNHNGRIPHGLGHSHRQPHDRRHLDNTRGQDVHKCIGTPGRTQSLPGVPTDHPGLTRSCHV